MHDYTKQIKNKWILADVSNGFFFTKTIKVYEREYIQNIISEMQNELYTMQEKLNKFNFIECSLCNSHMELINDSEYGCQNEDCMNIQRIC